MEVELEDELEESPRASCDWLEVEVEVEPAFGPTKSVDVFWTVDDCSPGPAAVETVVCSTPVGVTWVLVEVALALPAGASESIVGA